VHEISVVLCNVTQLLRQKYSVLVKPVSDGMFRLTALGALSPAQAHMYQQQMAMQHQQQHMKKRGRGGTQLSSGEMRRDGQSVLIGGQGLAVTPSGMTIGALTPTVVTSLGTFIGGNSSILGTQLIQQPMAGTHGASSQGFGVGCE
jgi:hypothetical protein